MNRFSPRTLTRKAALLLTTLSLFCASVASAADTASYPTEIIARPLTLPAGMLALTGSVQRAAFFGASATGLSLGAGYGVSQELEVSLNTGLGIAPDVAWGKRLVLGVGYTVMDTTALDIAIRLGVPLGFAKGGKLLNVIALGVDTRLQLTPKIALRAGQDLFRVHLDPNFTTVNGNVGIEFQASPQFGIGLSTQLFSVQLTGDGDFTNTIVDAIPFRLYGVFAVSHALDIFASFSSVDTGSLGDFNETSVGVNFRL